MSYFRDLREHLEALDKAGLLVKIDEAINKDTELMPLVRWQFRGLAEEERRGWLEALHAEQARGPVIAGRLHIFTWGRKPA